MFISRVKIKNFRSLVDVDVELGHYVALVGLNDSGKSNFLRALNLFFTSQTDPGQPLNFVQDFSQLARVKARKAKEITIELELKPPAHYLDSGTVVWKKVYREDQQDPHIDELTRKDGKDFARNSKIEYWARHIAFEYVPAIRGKHFFAVLKRRLYTTLAETVAGKLTSNSSRFLAGLRAEVKTIESESHRLLQLKTEFSLPSDLGALFEVLDFEASDNHSKTPLQYRGDGIQGRHIPVILKFLADQRKANSIRGKPAPETIWAFEEPENNLELLKQVEVADEFHDYSNSVQIFVSTHSPAFYAQAKKQRNILVAARINGSTELRPEKSANFVDSHLGLMPFVQPYLQKAMDERDQLVAEMEQLETSTLLKTTNALYVEGSSDKTILTAAFSVCYPELEFEIMTKDGLGAGANWVVGCCVARAALTDFHGKTVALLDDDEAGQKAKSDIHRLSEVMGKDGKVKCVVVGKKTTANDEIRVIKASGLTIPTGIEEVCGVAAWKHAEGKGWTEPRGTELMKLNSHKMKATQSFVDLIESRIPNDEIKRIVLNKLSDVYKGRFAKHVARQIEASGEIPPALRTLVDEIASIFS